MVIGNASRVALVTGGSVGIGRAVCEQLLAQGCEVVSLARRACDIDHPRLHSVVVDLGDRSATARTARELAERFEPTVVVHNAGAILTAPLPDVALDDVDGLVELHWSCAIQLVQAALPAMRRRRFGRIVLLSSGAALGQAGRTAYAATKAGLHALARTWALELGPDGITVNVVAPGATRTDMLERIVPAGSPRDRELVAATPVRRLGEPADVARAVAFFADPDNGYVTGQVLHVCGGRSVGRLAA